MEEFARFVLDDGDLSTRLKSIRHDVATSLARLPREQLLLARDAPGDVGTFIVEPSEYSRPSVASVIAAAASRVTQSLRVIEEYGKTIDPVMAAEIEQARYRSYSAAADLELRLPGDARRSRLASSSLYALIDAGRDEDSFADCVRQLCEGGVDILQLRDRRPDDRTLIARAKIGLKIARQFDVLFIINDRADIALAADADGVHVGQDELPVADARRILGPTRLIGLSTHSIDQAREATAAGADYIGCGPVFAGRTKTFESYVGPPFLREVAAEIVLPAFAIGGIDLQNLNQVIETGIRRIAVTGVVRDVADPKRVAAELKRRLSS